MADKAKRKYVVLELFVGNNTTKYKGRLIGLVDETEFRKIISSKVLQARIETTESKPLSEIVENFDDLDNLRMVISVREQDGRTVPKKLFITERLGFISAMSKGGTEVSITGDKGGWMMVSEEGD